jgi:putative ABC transport system permease protein
VIGVDDGTLIGLPQGMLAGSRAAWSSRTPCSSTMSAATRCSPRDDDPIGERLELNDQRAVVRGIVDAIPSFTSQVVLYTRYSQALNYVPGTRNRMSFVLARARRASRRRSWCERIERQTGLRPAPATEFAQDGSTSSSRIPASRSTSGSPWRSASSSASPSSA